MALTEQEELELLQLEEEEYQQSLKQQKSKDELSKTDTLVGAGLQGATFGFGDELTAAGAALADIAEGPKKLEDYKNLYNQYLKSERSQLKKEQEENPKTALAANIAGGFLTPGGSLLAGAKGAKQLATVGAGVGALAGLGTSEAETLPGMAQDVGLGAVGGAVLGPAIPMAISGVSKAASVPGKVVKEGTEFVANLPLVSDALAAAKGAAQGKKYSGQTEKYQSELRDVAKDAVDLLKELSLKKASKKGELLEQASTPENIADIAPKLLESYQKLKSIGPENLATQEQRKAAKDLEKFIKPVLEGSVLSGKNAKDLDKILKSLQDVIPQENKTKAVKDIGLDLLGSLKAQTEELAPELKPTNKELSDTMALFERLTGKSPTEYVPGMDVAENAKMLDKVTNVLKKSETEPTKLSDITEGFLGAKGLKNYAPDVADYISKRSAEAAKDLELAQKASGDVKYLGERLQTMATKGGELAGTLAKKTKDAAVGTVKEVTPDNMQQMALTAAEKFGETGKKLSNILLNTANKSKQERTAVMFGLMQTPEYRQMLNDLKPDNEEGGD